jgi:hypothetical protein
VGHMWSDEQSCAATATHAYTNLEGCVAPESELQALNFDDCPEHVLSKEKNFTAMDMHMHSGFASVLAAGTVDCSNLDHGASMHRESFGLSMHQSGGDHVERNDSEVCTNILSLF